MATAGSTNNGRAQQQSGGASLPPVQEQHMQQPVMQCPASRIPVQPPNPMMPGAAMYPFQEELMRPYVPNLPSSRILNPMMQGAAMYPFQAGLMRPYMPNMATHTIQFPTPFMSPFHSHSPAFNPQCPAINSHSPLTPAINPQPLRAFAVNHQPPLTPAVNPQPSRAPAVNPQPPPAPAANPQPQPAPTVNPQPPPTPAVNPQLPLPKKKRRRRKRNVAIDSKTKACVQVDTTQLRVPATPTGLGNTSVPLNRSLLQAVEDKMVGANQKRSCEANLEQLSELDKETVVKETRSIIEELCEDKDMKEAVECVKELKYPGILHVFVSEAINYALENTSECRQLVGQLFHQLLQDGTLAVDRMVAGLGAVMKTAEDIEIDVPKIWDYIGELLCPPVANRTLPLGTLISTTFPSNLLTSGKAALLTTKLLRQCVVVTSEEVVFQLWSSCKEQHDCLQLRPEDLEVVLKKAEQPSQRQAVLQLAVVSDGGDGRQGSRQGERNKIISPNPHSEPEVELRKAEQPWQRQAALKLELTDEQKETQEVFRKLRSILNKLTPQNVTELAEATRQLKINTEERLRGVVDLIFTRAITETMYSGEVYANLCQVLAPFDVETVNTKGKLKTITFKRLLLSKCEQEFLKGMQEDEERKTMQKGVETAETEEIRKQRQMELEAAEMASRHRSLGNMRFIGELYKLKMLSEFTIHECMIRLLKSSSNEKSLECFAKLMTITGTELDKEEAKLEMDIYFSRVNDIIKKRKISKRVQFVLQDVVDLRDNQWVPRKRQDTKLKTIDQIHREAEDEEQMTKQLASQYIGGDGGDERKGSIQVESRKIIPQNPHSALELRKAEQPWQRQAALKLELTKKQKETLEVFHKFRSILNRLTPQNVTKLADATCQLKINTEERLRGVVDLIFTRAIAETMYSEVYASLCRILFPWGVRTVNAKRKSRAIVFRCVLLTKCQQEFEKDMQEDEERETMQKGVETAETEEIRKQRQMALEAAEMASRQRMLGSIRFIGELYKLKGSHGITDSHSFFLKLKTLSESIMHECMRRFRKSSSDEKSLECFAMLMTVTGKELDKEEAKLEIDTYFSKVNDIIKKGKLSKRVQFVLQDVVDLRDNKWVPRQRQDTEVKTIAKQPWRRNAVLQLELTEEQETREVFRKVQSILNRLTPQKLTKLAKAIQQLKINTEERLRGVVDLIFTRATTEMTNCDVYTNLCRILASLAVETVNAEGKPQAVTFIRLLVIKCQQEFEKDMQEDEERKTMQKGVETAETEEIRKQRQMELEAAEMASRQRMLGSIRFIGELYKLKGSHGITGSRSFLLKLKTLSESIMRECMRRFRKTSSDEKSLECFAKLMTVTGKELDKEEAKLEIDTYFSKVNDIIKKGKLSKRVQFVLQDVVDLRDNKWVPRQRQDTEVKTIAKQPWRRNAVLQLELTEEQETREVFRKVQSILNRLTPQKLTKLAKAIQQLKINTEERLRGVVDLIFTRATTEMTNCEVYTNLCRVLASLAVETVNAEGKPQAVTFIRLLVIKCQQEFEKDMQEDEERKTMQKGVETAETEEIRKQRQTALEAVEMASRHRSLGNIRFIGELYNLKILFESTIHECMIRLLKSSSNEKSLECFAKLMTVTGTELNKEKAKLEMDTYFSTVNDIIKKGKISKRVQFALQDVVDLRDNQWVPRQWQNTKLKKAEQPWRRQAVLQLDLTEERKTQDVFCKFRSVLNRLTPQKLTKLVDATLQLNINTEERLRGVVDMIFTRAITETMYSEVYANFCCVLLPFGIETVNAERKPKTITFKCLLVIKCQQEFEKDKQEDEERETMQKGVETAETEEIRKQRQMELEAAEMASRQQMLGSIRFIGELYKLKGSHGITASCGFIRTLKTLSESIMHECMRRFRKTSSDEKSLECFAMLMTVTGKELDKEKTKLEIDTYYSTVNDIINRRTISKRVQFVLQDVVDLRDNKWVPRQRQDAKVKTIDQIHREAEDEEQMTKQLASQYTRGDGRRKHGLLHGRKVATPQSPHSVSLEDLTARLGFANVSNNEILKWIERSCTPEECRSPTFIRTLTTAMVQGAVTGKGSNAHYAEEIFHRRLVILRKYVNSDENLELEVLLALEMAVAKLDHPPKLLCQMFTAVYDCEVVEENSCYTWRDRAQEGVEGKGTAIMSVKGFFDWLESAERESDHPEGTSGKRQA